MAYAAFLIEATRIYLSGFCKSNQTFRVLILSGTHIPGNSDPRNDTICRIHITSKVEKRKMVTMFTT